MINMKVVVLLCQSETCLRTYWWLPVEQIWWLILVLASPAVLLLCVIAFDIAELSSLGPHDTCSAFLFLFLRHVYCE